MQNKFRPMTALETLRSVEKSIRTVRVKEVNRDYLDDVAFMIDWACARIEDAGKTE